MHIDLYNVYYTHISGGCSTMCQQLQGSIFQSFPIFLALFRVVHSVDGVQAALPMSGIPPIYLRIASTVCSLGVLAGNYQWLLMLPHQALVPMLLSTSEEWWWCGAVTTRQWGHWHVAGWCDDLINKRELAHYYSFTLWFIVLGGSKSDDYLSETAYKFTETTELLYPVPCFELLLD